MPYIFYVIYRCDDKNTSQYGTYIIHAVMQPIFYNLHALIFMNTNICIEKSAALHFKKLWEAAAQEDGNGHTYGTIFTV